MLGQSASPIDRHNHLGNILTFAKLLTESLALADVANLKQLSEAVCATPEAVIEDIKCWQEIVGLNEALAESLVITQTLRKDSISSRRKKRTVQARAETTRLDLSRVGYTCIAAFAPLKVALGKGLALPGNINSLKANLYSFESKRIPHLPEDIQKAWARVGTPEGPSRG